LEKLKKGDTPMNDSNVIELRKPAETTAADALTSILRKGAQELLSRAIEEEVKIFLESYAGLLDEKGLRQIVRNGYLPERNIQTGIGAIAVKVPRLRDRSGSDIKYTSNLVPRYLRRTKNIEELLPLLYLKGLSTGDFGEALASLVGSASEMGLWAFGKHFVRSIRTQSSNVAGFTRQPMFSISFPSPCKPRVSNTCMIFG
jgi:putative transposase